MEINIDNDIVKYNYNNHMSFFREINEKCKSYIWDLVEEHMDMVYVDIMSNAEIRFGNRKYVRYLTAFQDFSELVFAVFIGDMDALSDVCSQVHTRAKIANDDDSYQCKVLKDYYEVYDKEMVHFRRHRVLEQGSLMKGRAIFNSEKRMLKLISGFVNIVFELIFELEYYRNKNFQRPFYSHLKEYTKEEIIYGNFSYCLIVGEGFIRYMRAIALVVHQCCMYKLHTCNSFASVLQSPPHYFFDIYNSSFASACFLDMCNSFVSAFEKVNEREWADKEIFDEMGKLVRIVSKYDYIDTVNYKESFITFLIYNYRKFFIF
jgi:hypothetical protein